MKKIILLSQTGFTLIEAMVTVVAIGILAAVAVPVYNSYVEDARCSEAVKLLGVAINDAEMVIQGDNGLAGYGNGRLAVIDGTSQLFDMTVTTAGTNATPASDSTIAFTATGKAGSSVANGTVTATRAAGGIWTYAVGTAPCDTVPVP